jgi:hypothetical protein
LIYKVEFCIKFKNQKEMNNLPVVISILFVIITLLTVWQFYNAANKSKTVIVCLSVWLVLQAIIGLSGFYQVTQTFPPRFVLLIGPGLLFSILLLLTNWGRSFVDSLNIQKLTLLHTLRIPVEITLYFVCIAKLIPGLMTFEGNNYDIISGLSAPVIFYLVFVRKKLNNNALLVWNFGCLGLLINVLIIAILSAQTPFQQLAFDQPNIGVTFFPFVWLPAVVVPIVFLSHLAAIRQLILARKRAARSTINHSLNIAN